jgi:hypothetical protein
MTQNAKRVIVPGNGRLWWAAVDSPPPGQLVSVSGAPTAAALTFTVGGQATPAINVTPATVDADILTIAQAIAALPNVGAGKVAVIPAGLTGLAYLIVIDPSVVSQTITVAGTFTGGTAPAATVATTAVGLGPWTPFTEFGHTSKDSPLQLNRSGGDVTTLGSWQADAIDTSTAAVTNSLAYSLLQYDYTAMRFYHGSNAVTGANGMLQPSQSTPTATEHALFLWIRNGSKAEVRGWPRVSTLAADAEAFDTAKLAGMPIASTVLSSSVFSFGTQLSQVGAAA